MNNRAFLNIDGSFGEGGGAILRLSSAFSVLYRRSINITNIRANRPKKGLRMQHLKGLLTLSELTNSHLSDCDVGSSTITFIPKTELKERVKVEISTAGSIGLLLQPIQIACLGFTQPEHIEIFINGGGTFGKWAPSLNYLKQVTYKVFKNHGYNIEIEILKHGFYPKGGANVKCTLYPPKSKLKPIDLTELGVIEKIQGDICATNHLKSANVGERIKKSIINQLKQVVDIEVNVSYGYVDSISPGVGLSLWAQSDTGAIISTGTILGEKKLTSEQLGKRAAKELIKYLRNDIPVDNYLSDQIIPFMAFVKESSRIKVLEITNHTRTNLDLVKLFTNRNYKILKKDDYFIIEYS